MTALPALDATSLATLAARRVDGIAIELPGYPRRITHRICHLGVGAFHRAHQAQVLHRLLLQGDAAGWGLCGIGLRAPDAPLLRALQSQDGLYSLWESTATTRRVRVIGSLMQFLDASADSAPAVALLADPATRIVSLTITEAGYCLDAAGRLDLAHGDVAHDLSGAASPRSAAGVIVRALQHRRAAGLGGFTAMSCDNLIDNGHRLRDAVLGLAQRVDTGLAEWISREASFPLSMVDRITPAADPARSAQLCAELGLHDAAPVLCEDWLQWILEDRFVAGRPPFEKAGVVMSAEVKRYEAMKVGLLNGGHSAIAHVGLLLGYVQVHEAMADAGVRGWLAGYLREVAQTLTLPAGVDVDAYAQSLVTRFSNPAIADRLQRLAQDTSAKLQQAMLPPLRARLARGLPVTQMAGVLAAWLTYLATLADDAAARERYQDVDRDALIAGAAAALRSGDPGSLVARLFALEPLPAGVYVAAVTRALQQLRSAGLRALL